MGFFKEQLRGVGVAGDVGVLGAVSFFGIWAQHVWIFWINTNNHTLPNAFPRQSLYLVLSIVLLLVAFRFLARRRAKPIPHRRAFDVAAALACVAGTVGVAAAQLVSSLAFLSAPALALGGVGFAWLYLMWGAFYAKLDIKKAVAFLFTGGMIAAVVKVILAVLPFWVSSCIATALPVFSLVMCWCASEKITDASTNVSAKASVVYTKQNLPGLWKVAATFVVFSVANAFILSGEAAPTLSAGMAMFVVERFIEFALCACVLLYVFQLGRSFDFVQLWRIVLLVLATDFLVNIVVPGTRFQSLFADVSLNFIVLFVWLVLADVGRHSSLHPFVVFGIGWSCYTLPFYIGSMAAKALGFSEHSTGIYGILLYVVALTAAFCLEIRDQNTKQIFFDLRKDRMSAPEDFKDIDGRCEALGRASGLTAREIEVMQMLCKGRSKAYIAETLFVTENTVKGHTKNLYSKLNVHSRGELQELIDAA